jgi:transposase InsO family protein
MAECAVVSFSELCHRFNVSRKTGYKWLNRYRAEGIGGLMDRSRRPHRITRKLDSATEKEIISLREGHPYWGARKIRQRLKVVGMESVPACSTITAVLHRHDLINPEEPGGRKDWRRFEHPVPNSLWQMDFKSPVKTLAGDCQPLTVLDDHSRFNLCLQALPNQQTAGVRQTLTETFRHYGLPDTLLMDNGSPWGGDARHTYTPLTVWLIRLNIGVSHSRPYHPQTLGKDERFHGTLERELISQYQWRNLGHLQESFDWWRVEYNFQRPHDSLDLQVPATRYQPSLRSFSEALPPIQYPSDMHVRKVQYGGFVHFKGRTFRVSKAFHRYPVGIRPTLTDGILDVMFCHKCIGEIDLTNNT